MDNRPIGVFDSGVGGLSIVREIRAVLPFEDIVYFADEAHCPYGPRPLEEIRALAVAAAQRLLDQNAKLIVVACNTASTAALSLLRGIFPVPFVGVVPAVKSACASTRSGKVGVLATEATLKTDAFELLVTQFAGNAEVIRQPCPEFVALVEAGVLAIDVAEAAVRRRVQPLVHAGVDCLVLGCTHFEFLRPLIEEAAGPAVEVVGAAEAVAAQTRRVLQREWLAAGAKAAGQIRLLTSGDRSDFLCLANRLLGPAPLGRSRTTAQDVP